MEENLKKIKKKRGCFVSLLELQTSNAVTTSVVFLPDSAGNGNAGNHFREVGGVLGAAFFIKTQLVNMKWV